MIEQLVINGLVIGFIYVLIALGLTLMVSIMGIMNFAHGAFYMMGGFTVYFFFSKLGINYFLVLILTMVITGAFGLLVEMGFFYRLRGKFIETATVAVGILFVLQQSALLTFGLGSKGVPSVFTGTTQLWGITLSNERVSVAVICLALVIGLVCFLHWSKVGQAMIATAQDAEAAALQGVSQKKVRFWCMCIGCALAGVAGGLVGPIFSVHPHMGLSPMVTGFVVIAIGGLGSIPGAAIAGLMLGLINSIGAGFMGELSQSFGFIFLIVILLFRPQGLFGHA